MKFARVLARGSAFLLLLFSFNFQLSTTFAQGTAFTYQGRLSDGAIPASGIYDLRFAVYDSLAAGTRQGSFLTNSFVPVSNGLFTVTLDFGAGIFTGSARWLEIAVRAGATYTNLVPRQSVTPIPYAIYSGGATASGLSGQITGSQIAAGSIGPAQITNTATLWSRLGADISYSVGNVGIGITNPTTKLQVAGEITTVAVNITSDRNAKEQFKPVDARDVLDRVARLPISEWQYKENADSRHIGPMAQDFHAAFAVGRDDKHIATVDADGVALAAIQGLNQKLEEQLRDKDRRIQELERAVEQLRALVQTAISAKRGVSQ
jgi:hypothetical protein